MASANALLVAGLLDHGCEVTFFSKASFVDPRPAVGERAGFRFVNVDNRLVDWVRSRLAALPVANQIAAHWDSATYNRLLVRRMNELHRTDRFDLALWLGDYAHGPLAGAPTVSFAQGPPGTDARSLISRSAEIARLAGPLAAWKWKILARLRLASFGLPRFAHSDGIIVGSAQSRRTLTGLYGVAPSRIRTLPYPIDLTLFTPTGHASHADGPLRCLWLGRIVPRKRLDLFLDGAALAVSRKVDVHLTIAGDVGFIPGYERLITSFPFPERLTWHRTLPRENVPALLAGHDVLAQPSEEENFGSSVAEAQACGLPVIVGATNGNADYLSLRDIHLADYRPETFAEALAELARRKSSGTLGDPDASRQCAERHFSPQRTINDFVALLQSVAR